VSRIPDGFRIPPPVVVNPITNRIYVPNLLGRNVTVIDGATNSTTTVGADAYPFAAVVNPITNRVYVANAGSNNVTVITDAPTEDTKVRAAFDHLPGDTTSLAQPPLTGKGVNRWTPGRTTMMGVLNRVGTAQMPWGWATVAWGAGTDSITWQCNWGTDSLIRGENFICCVPVEDQAATSNNLGIGTPFAGDLEVYPVYRLGPSVGAQELATPGSRTTTQPTIVRGVLRVGDREQKTGDGTNYSTSPAAGSRICGPAQMTCPTSRPASTSCAARRLNPWRRWLSHGRGRTEAVAQFCPARWLLRHPPAGTRRPAPAGTRRPLDIHPREFYNQAMFAADEDLRT